jgi:hypothetical protein
VSDESKVVITWKSIGESRNPIFTPKDIPRSALGPCWDPDCKRCRRFVRNWRLFRWIRRRRVLRDPAAAAHWHRRHVLGDGS